MEEDNNLVNNTLNVMSESIGAFDTTLGKIPIYKSGHNVGALISRLIDSIVDSIPIADRKSD